MAVSKYDENTQIVTTCCGVCGKETSHDISGWVPVFNEEFNQYEALPLKCVCGTAEFLNVHIPPISDMEVEVMEYLVDESDRNARNEIRKIIWQKLPEYADVDRDQYEQKYATENAEDLAAIRERLRGNET